MAPADEARLRSEEPQVVFVTNPPYLVHRRCMLRDTGFGANMYTTNHKPRMEDMSSTTVSVRINPAIKKRLEKLAKSTGRSRSFLAAEAINEYLDLNEWQVAGIQKAMASLDRGKGVPHERVKEWVSSWGSKNERPAPKRSAT